MVQELMNFLKSHWLPILAGFLIGTSYIPFPPWALFFCLVPLFLFWTKTTNARTALIGGWITQTILNAIGFHWIAYTATEFGHFPWWGGVLTLIGFCFIAHLYYAAAGWIGTHLIRLFRLRSSFSIFVYATVFALMDHVFPKIFPWHLGYPWLWANWPGAQFGDVIGFEGLNILTIYINAFFAWSILLWQEKRAGTRPADQKFLLPAAAALALLVAVNLAGWGREKTWRQTDAELPILMVQGNIGNFDKLMAERGRAFRIPIIQKYIELSRKGLQDHPEAKLLVWPETAFPDLLDPGYLNDMNAQTLRGFLREARIPLFTGAYSYQHETKQTYNGFFYLDDKGQAPLPAYRKSILLAFGETFPFADYIPYMKTLLPDMSPFGRGDGPTVMDTGSLKVGPQICYEGLYPWFSAGLTQQGAQVIINVTNDSWFGTWFEPYQHMTMTLARAVEFRRPLIRATNTGITTVVLASGEVLEKSPLQQEWVGFYRVPYMTQPPHSFYENIAGQWVWALVLLLSILVGWGRERSKST